MSAPLVSVIIPSYNANAYLKAALASVCDQACSSMEVIVVDDGSKTSCEPICAEFSKVRYVCQEHAGPAVAMNTGLSHATGTYIAFHNADDLFLPGKLEAQIQVLDTSPDMDFVLTQLENFVEPGIESPGWFQEEQKRKERMGFVSTALIRAEVFEKVGLFNPNYLIGEDMDWLIRAQELGVKSQLIEQVYTRRRIHDKNLSADVELGHSNLLTIIHESVRRRRNKPQA